eukprot:Colp12_sorted_trinity150504_noHs@33802
MATQMDLDRSRYPHQGIIHQTDVKSRPLDSHTLPELLSTKNDPPLSAQKGHANKGKELVITVVQPEDQLPSYNEAMERDAILSVTEKSPPAYDSRNRNFIVPTPERPSYPVGTEKEVVGIGPVTPNEWMPKCPVPFKESTIGSHGQQAGSFFPEEQVLLSRPDQDVSAAPALALTSRAFPFLNTHALNDPSLKTYMEDSMQLSSAPTVASTNQVNSLCEDPMQLSFGASHFQAAIFRENDAFIPRTRLPTAMTALSQMEFENAHQRTRNETKEKRGGLKYNFIKPIQVTKGHTQEDAPSASFKPRLRSSHKGSDPATSVPSHGAESKLGADTSAIEKQKQILLGRCLIR